MSDIQDALKNMQDIWDRVSENQTLFGEVVLQPSHVDQINENFNEWMQRAEKAEAKVKELEESNTKLKNGVVVLDEIIKGYINSEDRLKAKVKELETMLNHEHTPECDKMKYDANEYCTCYKEEK